MKNRFPSYISPLNRYPSYIINDAAASMCQYVRLAHLVLWTLTEMLSVVVFLLICAANGQFVLVLSSFYLKQYL